VVEALPEATATGNWSGRQNGAAIWGGGKDGYKGEPRQPDSGSAARFFYSAKADANDRIGSKHPTVKPVDLMRWLVRLITPPGGTVLDPFAGTGTTGEAAFYEGFNAVLIEREAEYQADIARRMRLALAGPDERVRESIKASGKAIDAGPLFGEVA
jgi:site-specific DNA-methyltransferase (adenine-specific)